MSTNYDELMTRARRDLPKPELPPAGRGIFRLGHATLIKPDDPAKSPRVLLNLRYAGPHPDSGIDPSTVNIKAVECPPKTIFFTRGGDDWNEIADAAGLPAEMSVQEACVSQALDGREVSAMVKHGVEREGSPRAGQPTCEYRNFQGLG